MIRNRLAELLFERDIKIVRMSKEIGISRNTITNTASNNSEMLQMNTINKICSYLKITPCEFFDYIPLDIEFSFFENQSIDIVAGWNLSLIECQINLDIDLLLDIESEGKNYKIDTKLIPSTNIILNMTPTENNIALTIDSDEKQLNTLKEIFKDIPKEFKKVIYNNLISEYKKFIAKNIDLDEIVEGNTKRDLINTLNFTLTNDFIKYY